MKILISNDDGMKSEGIKTLAKVLSREHTVFVVCPEENKSACSHSLTIGKEIELNEFYIADNIKSYSFSGTPADCVKFAIYYMDLKPDIVVSGINSGLNLGSDVVYSGTMSASLEGAGLGLGAIAFSSVARSDNDYKLCAEYALKIIDKFKNELVKNIAWNVNFPYLKDDEKYEIKLTSLGLQLYNDYYKNVGGNKYLLSGQPIEHDQNNEDSDVELFKKGFITMTPVHFNATDYEFLFKTKNKFKDTY